MVPLISISAIDVRFVRDKLQAKLLSSQYIQKPSPQPISAPTVGNGKELESISHSFIGGLEIQQSPSSYLPEPPRRLPKPT